MAELECLAKGIYTISPSPQAARVGIVCVDAAFAAGTMDAGATVGASGADVGAGTAAELVCADANAAVGTMDASAGAGGGTGNVHSVSAVYLIDSGGCAHDAKIIMKAIEASLGEVKVLAVILTHSHSDHAGGAAQLVRQTGCEVWTTAGERGGIENNLVQAAVTCGGEPMPEISVPYYVCERCNVKRVISSADSIPLGKVDLQGKDCTNGCNSMAGRMLTFVPLHGHYFDMTGVAADSMDGRRVFFVADALFGFKMVGRFPIPFMLDIGAFLDSLDMIEQYAADVFVPSHGDVLTSSAETVEMNRLAILTTIAAIEKALENKRLTTDGVLEAVADAQGLKMRPQQYFLVGSTVRSFLAYLYKKKRIACRMEGNRLLWEKAQD